MKIFAAGDIHADSRIAEQLAAEAAEAKADLVLLCGDVTNFDMEASGVIAPFKERNLQVAMIHGNHDSEASIETLSQIYKTKNLHGYSMRIGDIGIFACGGATNVGPMPTISEEETLAMLQQAHEYIKDAKVKIMMTHMHPQGSIVERISFEGSQAVRDAIDDLKPDVHISGHIHEADGIEEMISSTRVVSVGKKGKLFEF